MKKYKLTKTLTICVICGAVALNYCPVFAANSYWASQSISDFLSNKIDAPTVLKDDKYTTYITRENFSQLIVGLYAKSNAINKNDIQLKENPFKDTTNLDVQRAYSLGIIQGVSQNEFNPNSNITREEIATMIVRFLNIKGIKTNSINSLDNFNDKNNISNWAFKSLAYCVDNQIIQGFQNDLKPKLPATVEETITMLDRIASKNNWIVKSKDIYVCGFLYPNDTTVTYEILANNVFVLAIRWNTINDIEKLKSDLAYMFNSKSNQSNDDVKKVIDSIIKSKQTSKTENDQYRVKSNIKGYEIGIIGNEEISFISFYPIN
ncbi:MAG: S-layer homology domain-containing protein [Aminipila sp.]